jgi:DNA-binding CsgD family transcriptional regulator
MARTLIGREGELGAIQAFLEQVQAGPAVLVLSGEPGIGKTILWEAGIEEAQKRFGRVLSHRSVEAEASLAFAGLSDLVGPVLGKVAALLPPPRRSALEVALLLAEPGEQPPDPRAIGLALLDVLRLLAQQAPVVVALDDLQWFDPSSSAVLQIGLRRLQDEPVGLLATLREAPDVAASFELEGLPQERLSLGPLGLPELHQLLSDRLGLELARPELVRIQEQTVGNPFFALELGRELERRGVRPEPGKPLPIPESLGTLLGERLARLPEETRDVLLVAAAAGRPTVDMLAAAHGGEHAVQEALELVVREGVVLVDDLRIRFSHPLLAAVCYEQPPLWRRRAVHRELAGAVDDVEERARHLALAAESPDAAVASELDAAAEHAAARGAPATAADLSELAAELTRPDPARARQRRLRAANFHRMAGNGERSVAVLEGLLAEVPSGVERADVLLALAPTLRGGAPAMIDLCEQALAEASADDARAARILAMRSWLHVIDLDPPAALVAGRAALEKAERVGDPSLVAMAIGYLGVAESLAGEPTPGLLERGAEIEERQGLVLEYHESPRLALARLGMRLGELDRARAIFEETLAKAAMQGDEGTRGEMLWELSLLEWVAGRWQRALELAVGSYELAGQTQGPAFRAAAARNKALIEADLGLAEEARASAEEILAIAQAIPHEFFGIFGFSALGHLELALGEVEAACSHLRKLPGQLLRRGSKDPFLPLWSDAIEALIALGELEQARSYLEQHELHASRLESPWALANAARCRGLLAAAEGDLNAAFSAFEHVLGEAEVVSYPFEHGRTLLCLGMVRRQARQKRLAREALEQALAIFEELGARPWAEKARAELRRISGRRPSSELTETEERTARLAAEGRSNKEIASALFMSVHTVEAHLTRIYRKLGIHSRTELAARLPSAETPAKPAGVAAKE